MDTEVVIGVALRNIPEDFSCNARTDILEKYSRFHGKTEFSVWCNAPDVKYIDSFRDLIFEINPHHITCVYKKMFETAALINLGFVDGDIFADDETCRASPRSLASFRNDSDCIGYFQEHVDKSNSCVYSQSLKSHGTSKGALKLSDLHGWDICDKPHSVPYAWNQKCAADDTRDLASKRQLKTGSRSLSPALKSLPSMLRVAKNIHGNAWRNTSAGSRLQSRDSSMSRETDRADSPSSRSSSSTGCIGTNKTAPIKIGRRFRHYKRSSCYMDQYREEYTYRRLFEAREAIPPMKNDVSVCTCVVTSCAGTMAPTTTSSSAQRWYPTQSHLKHSKSAPAFENEICITTGIPVPKRTPVLKTRPPTTQKQNQTSPYVLQVPKIEDKPKTPTSLGFHRDSIPKLEFFASSFTVNSYNPVKTPPSPAHKSSCTSPSSAVSIPSGRVSSCGKTESRASSVDTSARYQLNQNPKGME